MTPKSQSFSICYRITHEIVRGYKELISEGHDQQDLIKNLRDQESRNIKYLAKLGAAYLAIIFALKSTGPEFTLSIPTAIGKIDLPLIYILLIAAILFSALCLSTLKAAIFIISKQIITGNIATNTRFSAAKSLFHGDENVDITSPIRNGGLIKLTRCDSLTVSTLYLLIILTAIIPFVFSFPIIFLRAIETIEIFKDSVFEFSIAFSSCLLIFSSFTYIIIFFTPLTTKPDQSYIRFLFLYPIGKDENGLHPRSKHWSSGI